MRSLILIAFLLSSFSQAGTEQAHEFGSYLQNLIVKGDQKAFASLPCFPVDCIDKDDIDYVFGAKGNTSFIKLFLGKPGIKTKVFGPFAHEGLSKGSNYILLYYDPTVVKFNDKGYLSEIDRQTLWWKGYIETIIHYQNGIWGFKETPFYHGAHLPWAEDY